jgi:ComEC/Rec2-related protein
MQKMHRWVQVGLLFFIAGAAMGTSFPSRATLIIAVVVGLAAIVLQSAFSEISMKGTSAPYIVLALSLTVGIARGSVSEQPAKADDGPNRFQTVLQKRIDASIGRPESALAAGLLSGERTSIPTTIKDNFRESGLSHLLAVSGYNVTIVTSLLLLVLKNRAPPAVRLLCALIGIALFVIGAGASAAVVRAGIMGGLTALALHSGRQLISHRALLLAAVGMVAVQPWLVVFDIGFQLSVTATLVILVLGKRLQKTFVKVPEFLALRANLATTISATLGTLPLIIFHFGVLPALSIPANLLAAPFIPIAMGVASIGALLGDTFLGRVIGAIGAQVLLVLETIAEYFARGPALNIPETLRLTVAIAVTAACCLAYVAIGRFRSQVRLKKKRLLL